MSLFDQILSAVNNPEQQASPDHLSGILGAVQQTAGNHGLDPGMTQMVVSALGGHVQSALQNQANQQGGDYVQGLVNQFSGLGSNPQAVDALFGGNQHQVATDVAQRTGLDPSMIAGLLPMLIPVVLNLLQGGANSQNAQAGNPVLNAFLDSNRDGSLDLGDAMNLAGQFLGQRRWGRPAIATPSKNSEKS
jgi:hypothetical protein